MARILVLYYSRHGSTRHMAEEIADGVESMSGAEAVLRTVPAISATCEAREPTVPDTGAPYITLDELGDFDGYLIGSPTRFGHMAAPLKYFIDQTSAHWQSGALIDKPVGCFTSTASLHGGQETTLLSMMLPFIHHGAIIMGVPYSETALFKTDTGGTPYGSTHVSGSDNNILSEHEKTICHTQGRRMAMLAQKLKDSP